jgi:glutathione-regulated potassium-efflux system ancillary protein KefC
VDSSLFVAIVLVVAGLLTLEFRISSAIVEVVAGVLLSVFVDVGSLGWLAFLAHLGMLGLMFMAGFEVNPLVLRHRWRASVLVGAASFLVPLVGVYGVAHQLLGLSPQVAALVAIGLSTTSLALVYQFLRERGLLAADEGQGAFAAAMVVDVLSMVALALLLGRLGWATAIFLVVVVPLLVGLPRFGQWIFRRYEGSPVEFELRFLLLVLVGLGFLAEHAGLHAAVVAFLVGLLLSEVVQDHEALEDKLKGVVFSFFAPVFFLRAGALIDLTSVDMSTLGVTGVLLAAAVGLKYAGTALVGRWVLGTGGHALGILFNYRLTFGIITATVGLEEGLLGQRLFTAVLLIVLLSAALPMILLRDLPSEFEK